MSDFLVGLLLGMFSASAICALASRVLCNRVSGELREAKKDIFERRYLEDMRRNREESSGWLRYWRNKNGYNDLWYPDWGEVFSDWEARGREIESLYREIEMLRGGSN